MANYTSGSLTSPNLEIGIALVLQDRFSNQAREASGAIRKLHSDAMAVVNANINTARTVADSVYNLSTTALGAISDAVMTGAEFIDTMTTVEAITKATEDQMDTLGNTAQTLGLRTMFASRDIASGMQYLAMAGNSAEDINKMIEGAAMVANATGMELGGKGGAADMITNVMRTFRVESAEAASVIGDQLTKATLSSNMSMYDLAESLKYASSDMVTLGKQLPEVSALIGTLGNAGIQGSMAGTALSNMARYFGKSVSDPSFKGFKELQKLGIYKDDITDANGNLLDFGIILGKVKASLEGLDSIAQNRVLGSVFGVRGKRAGVALMRDIDGYFSLLDKIKNESAGYTESIVEKRMGTLAGSIDQMRSAWENLKTTFAETVEPLLAPVFRGIAKIIQGVQALLDIPLLGQILALGRVVMPLIGLVVGGIVKIRTWSLSLFNNSQVSAASMFAVLRGGWQGAKLDALAYQRIERAIIAQRRAGIRGNTGMAINNSGALGAYTRLSNGRYKDMATGRYISKREAAARRLANMRASRTSGGIVRSIMGSSVAGVGSVGIGGGGILRGIGGLIGGLSRGLLSFLGGPVGLAITALSIGLPLLTNAIKNNRESQEDNTKAIRVLNAHNANEEAKARNEQLHLTQEMRLLVNSLFYWAGEIQNSNPAVVNINVDGKTRTVSLLPDTTQDVSLTTGTR